MKQHTIKHPIEKHIMSVLLGQKEARFSDMRPKRADSNLYSYHLTKLVSSGHIKKVGKAYSLDINGLSHVQSLQSDSYSTIHTIQIMIMFVVQNSDGDTLLERQMQQPFISTLSLPGGLLRADDLSVEAAASRILTETLQITSQKMHHAGNCYVRVRRGNTHISTTLIHVFTFNSDDISVESPFLWAQPHSLPQLSMSPGVDQIIARTFFRDPFYFEEFDAQW